MKQSIFLRRHGLLRFARNDVGATLEEVMIRRTLLAALIATFSFANHAFAENYPSRPVTIIVPFAAGGPSDAMARILAERMKVTLGQPVLVENVTGAGGSIGVGRAVHSPPDGYTISFGHLGTHVCNGAIYKLDYDLVADLQPVALLPSNPMVIVSKNAVPARTLPELLDWLKSQPQPATAGTAGAGSAATSRASRSRTPPASSCNMCLIAAPLRR
jgi:tripartite-type tricarboxylate transporter receptor subunit TctC